MKVNRMLAVAALLFALTAIPHAAPGQDTDNRTHMATGCLRQSTAKNLYHLTDENGKPWNIHGAKARLDPYVGHTVTVTGTVPKPKSSDTSPQNDLLVTKIDEVNSTCAQP